MTAGRDDDLIVGLRSGELSAFEAVFRSYHAQLCAFANSYLQNRAEAEEIVQDLFLALWQKRDRLEVRTSLRGYLFGATRNRVLNRSARAKLEQKWLEQLELADSVVEDSTMRVDQISSSSHLSVRVSVALESLPPGCRQVLLLRWQQQLSYAEIAETLGISVKGVENQLSRARKALRAQLGDVLT